MIYIAHRGNLDGSNPNRENSPDYIEEALSRGYDAEIDVWYISDSWYLGHDAPQHWVSFEFLKNDGLWCHAKNLNALEKMLEADIHCFWHQEDDYTVTSRGYVWAYPGKPVGPNTILVSRSSKDLEQTLGCYGVCSDQVSKWKKTN